MARRVSRMATATINAAVAAPVITSVIVPYAVDRTNSVTVCPYDFLSG